jgi:uncharacterized coiled-coil DUF342 family protein
VSERLISRLCDEIDALSAELERTRVGLHVEAAAADAEATFANELNADVAELRAERDRLAARVAELEGALRQIRVGKIPEDNEHPVGQWFSMASRFINIAKDVTRNSQ